MFFAKDFFEAVFSLGSGLAVMWLGWRAFRQKRLLFPKLPQPYSVATVGGIIAFGVALIFLGRWAAALLAIAPMMGVVLYFTWVSQGHQPNLDFLQDLSLAWEILINRDKVKRKQKREETE